MFFKRKPPVLDFTKAKASSRRIHTPDGLGHLVAAMHYDTAAAQIEDISPAKSGSLFALSLRKMAMTERLKSQFRQS